MCMLGKPEAKYFFNTKSKAELTVMWGCVNSSAVFQRNRWFVLRVTSDLYVLASHPLASLPWVCPTGVITGRQRTARWDSVCIPWPGTAWVYQAVPLLWLLLSLGPMARLPPLLVQGWLLPAAVGPVCIVASLPRSLRLTTVCYFQLFLAILHISRGTWRKA